jgi:hypothetical protein
LALSLQERFFTFSVKVGLMSKILMPFPFKTPGVFLWTQETIGQGRWLMGQHITQLNRPKPEPGDMWIAYRTDNGMMFEFKNESDASMFGLRWL